MHTPTDGAKAVGKPATLSTGGTTNKYRGIAHF
jgi:hypothetical protein